MKRIGYWKDGLKFMKKIHFNNEVEAPHETDITGSVEMFVESPSDREVKKVIASLRYNKVTPFQQKSSIMKVSD